jgi:hypothetical protein
VNTKLAFAILAFLLVGFFSIQTAKSQTTTDAPLQTQSPDSTPLVQQSPISPWLLMLAVFASVSLTALVLSGVQKLRARTSK